MNNSDVSGSEELVDLVAAYRDAVTAWEDHPTKETALRCVKLLADLDVFVADALAFEVEWAREQQGASWADVAATLGTTRQNAQQRFGTAAGSTAKSKRPTAVPNQHPGSNSIGAMVPEGWNLRSEAARSIGVSADTLKSWHRKYLQGDTSYADLIPTGRMKAGMLDVWLYSDDDIPRIRRAWLDRA